MLFETAENGLACFLGRPLQFTVLAIERFQQSRRQIYPGPRMPGFQAQRGCLMCEIVGKRGLIHVDSDPNHHVSNAGGLGSQLDQDAAEFFAVQQHVVRPAQIWSNRMLTNGMLCATGLLNGTDHRESGGERKQKRVGGSKRRTQNHGTINSGGSWGMPGVAAPASSRNLLLAEKHGAFGLACCGCLHSGGVRRSNLEVMMDALADDIAAHHG